MANKHTYENLSHDEQNVVNLAIEDKLSALSDNDLANVLVGKKESPMISAYLGEGTNRVVDQHGAKLLASFITQQREVLSQPESVAKLEKEHVEAVENRIAHENRMTGDVAHKWPAILGGQLPGLKSLSYTEHKLTADQVRTQDQESLEFATAETNRYQHFNETHDGTNPNTRLPQTSAGQSKAR